MSPATRRASPFERVDFPEHVDGFHRPFGRSMGQVRRESQYIPVRSAFYRQSWANPDSEQMVTAGLCASQSQTRQLDKFAASFFHKLTLSDAGSGIVRGRHPQIDSGELMA